MQRNKSLFFSVFFVLCALVSIAETHCYADGDDNEPVIIIIGDGSTGGGPSHHAPALIPISAEYYASLSSLIVDFLYDLGTLIVDIENQTTNFSQQTIINGTQGSHLLSISAGTGAYKITFTLTDGHTYIGLFEIE